MRKNNTKTPHSLAGFLHSYLMLNWQDALAVLGIQLAIGLAALGIQAAVVLFSKNPNNANVDVAGIVALFAGALVTFILAVAQFGINYTLATAFGAPRRRAVAAGWLFGLGLGALSLLISLLVGGLWQVLLRAPRPFPLFGYIPWWGWLSLVLVPVAAAVFIDGVCRMFGARGGAAIWLLFLVLCWAPQFLENTPLEINMAMLFAAAPALLLGGGVVFGAAGSALLLCAPASGDSNGNTLGRALGV